MPFRRLEPLFDRRVPQIVGMYLGASWGLVQFVNLLVERYLLSPHLVTFSMVVLALFIPSVCMMAWFHGAPGDDEWNRTETVGVSTNVVGGLVVLFLAFGGKDLGAATTTVSVTDEEGERVERTVPKSEFRKGLAVFYFDNETGDPDLGWLRYGLAEALKTDLNQDLFLRVSTGFAGDLQQRGFEDATGIPLALKRETARKGRREHFLSGSLLPSDSGFTVSTELRETETGDLVESRTFSGPDLPTLVDSMSVQLRRDLDVPSSHIEKAEDLPVAELTTGSAEAFRAYSEGYAAWIVRDDLDAAQAALEKAVSLDPTFALAQWMLSTVSMQQNRNEEAEAAISAAMEHLYRLPLRYQFQLKGNFYQFKQQPDKQLSVAEMRVEFSPEDVEGRLRLASLYRDRNRLEEALQQYRRILELAPDRHEYRDLVGDVYKEMGRYEDARAAYLEYAEHFPRDADPFHELGLLYQRTGRLDSAAAYFEKAHLVEPENVDYLLHLGRLGTYTGDFEAALERYEEAREAAATPSTRIGALQARLTHYKMRGQIREALEVRDELLAVAAAEAGPASAIVHSASTAGLYAHIDQEQEAFRILGGLEERAQFPLDQLVPLGRMQVHAVLEDPDAVEELLPAARAVIDNFGLESLRWLVHSTRAEIHRWRGECEEALPLYEEALSYNPEATAEVSMRVSKARCLRSRGQLDDAESEVREALTMIPVHPEALEARALIHRDRGDTARAVEALDEALRVYAPADSDFIHAGEVRTLREALRGS